MRTTISVCDICGKHDKPFDRLDGPVIDPIVSALASLGDPTFSPTIENPTQDSKIAAFVAINRDSETEQPIQEICQDCKFKIEAAVIETIKGIEKVDYKEAKSQ